MLLLINIRSDPFGNKPQSLKPRFGDSFWAGSLQVTGPMMAMSSTKGAEMQLELEMRCHNMGVMDFCRAKEVVAITLVGAKKLDARELGPNATHASHVEGAFDESHVLCKRQGQPTSNTPVISIEVVASFFGKLSGFFPLGDM